MDSQGEVNWVTAYKARDEWRAELVRAWIAEAGIPVIIQTNAVPGYNMLMGGQFDCWADILVPARCLEAAEEVMRSFMPEGEAPAEE